MIRISHYCLLVLLVLAIGCDQSPRKSAEKQTTTNAIDDALVGAISDIVDSEATILDLSPWFSKIGESLTENGSVSKERLREIFAAEVNLRPVNANDALVTTDLLRDLWQPFLGDQKFAECQFGTLSGAFDESNQRFEMKTKFEGKLQQGKSVTGVSATQTITWTRINKLWTITDWTQHSFDATGPSQPIFKDATARFITDEATRKQVSVASHQERIRKAVDEKSVMLPLFNNLPGFNDWESTWQYPSVSVVDFNNDGWDDIFLTDRWTGGMLLQNFEGKFVDITEQSGLKVGPNSNCTIFADFDNDGDQDAFVGRSIYDSQFFVNEGGTFRLDEDIAEELKLVRFVTAASVADFNQDGLLDLYVSTYVSPSGSASSDWVQEMLPGSDQKRMNEAMEQHPFLDRGGPANILLINVNGKLKRCESNDALKQWRNSYQSVWHDWDNDGDMDLFVCNDFAPDAFLRNETRRGSLTPKFVDVTQELIGPDIMGYSMGASWGDYDNDGDMDLFVSEMYSKAGNRILNQFADADQRSLTSATGNFLFQNNSGSFSQVAGKKGMAKDIAKVGWSFGGQFLDFDNNGWLDLYVPSGFYTAPKDIRSDADL